MSDANAQEIWKIFGVREKLNTYLHRKELSLVWTTNNIMKDTEIKDQWDKWHYWIWGHDRSRNWAHGCYRWQCNVTTGNKWRGLDYPYSEWHYNCTWQSPRDVKSVIRIRIWQDDLNVWRGIGDRGDYRSESILFFTCRVEWWRGSNV